MRRITSLIALTAFAVACSGKPAPPPPPVAVATPVPTPPPPAVGVIILGSEVGADKSVATPKEIFGRKDKIYASVATTGSGHFKLRGLWTYAAGEKITSVNDTNLEFDATGPATNEFHIENSKPWPKGDYKVEIFLNDSPTPSATKTFKVE